VLIGVAIAVGSPRRSIVLSILGMWCVACVAYILAVPSRKTAGHLLKNAFLGCAFAAAVTYSNHGEPESDEDGFIVEEGFDAIEAEKGAAAANAFARFGLGAFSGVGVALLVRRRARYRGANASSNEPLQQPEDSFEDGVLRDRCFTPLSRVSPMFALTASFTVSALIHAYAIGAALGMSAAASWALFFLAQPLAIAVERRIRVRRWPEPAARAWTVGTVIVLSPLFAGPLVRLTE